MGWFSTLAPVVLVAVFLVTYEKQSLALIPNTAYYAEQTSQAQPIRRRVERDTQRPPALADGCYHVFIDAGSNRGVHGRFLFEPEKYNRSLFTKKFDEIFGSNRTKQNICVFAFEPNVQKHNVTQRATQEAYAKMGWRYHWLPYGVSDKDGQVTFYRNLDYFSGLKREEWGFGTHLHGNATEATTVNVLDLSVWAERHVFNRSIPCKNKYNRAHPIVAMKMDVEGSEYRTIDHMMEMGTACKFDFILGELHFNDVPQSFGRHNLTLEKHVQKYSDYMIKMLAKKGCPKFLEFDDEQYLHDGEPYPNVTDEG
jgi:FkbM family methyltransferase